MRGALYGLAAAALFGLSAPVAKLLLPAAGPVLLAGMLYLGGALALFVTRALRRTPAVEAPLRKQDAPVLLAIIALGGVAGPVLMLVGLARLSGVAGALLLNLEAPFTILLAVALFGEHLSARELAGAAFILLGGAALGAGPGPLRGDPWGILALAGACLAWGLDNNLTQRLSLKDPAALVRVKAAGAGVFNLLLALAVGEKLPGARVWAGGLALGAVSYGVSIVLDVRALRELGAAREAAYFATAPFLGALLALPLLREPLRLASAAAMVAMALGVAVLLRARHGHLHTHEPMFHEHLHVHDEHHQHAHPPGTPEGEPHSHPHHHVALSHDHPHVADLHHRHRHP